MVSHAQGKLRETRDVDGLPAPSLSAETVVVCVLRSDDAQVLVLRGMHLADRLRGRLIVLHISEPGGGLRPDGSRGHQETVKALQLARALGAEVYTLGASSACRIRWCASPATSTHRRLCWVKAPTPGCTN